MRHQALIDTGPIVAILSRRDREHKRCVEALHHLSGSLLTTWPVITEACWLLRSSPTAVDGLFLAIRSGLFAPQELDSRAVAWIQKFLTKYRSIGAQLADASLCYLAEREGTTTVFTLDVKDFSVYRVGRHKSLQIIPG